jgi:competence CoiA-like predicted nuclease
MMQAYQKHTFETTFTKEISSILVEFLTLPEVFFKLNLINKNFHSIVELLKNYPKLWTEKFLQEFQSNEDINQKRWVTPEDKHKFLSRFLDNMYEPSSG